jgi:hypothetical protein
LADAALAGARTIDDVATTRKRTDGAGAMLQVNRVATGLRLHKVRPGFIYKSGLTAQPHIVPSEVLARCAEVGATLAAELSAGIY